MELELILIFYFFSVILAGLITWKLLSTLKSLLKEQIDKQVNSFASEAKIPKALRGLIKVKIKFE